MLHRLIKRNKRLHSLFVAFFLFFISQLKVSAQDALHLNAYTEFCEINSNGTLVNASNYTSNAVDKKYELIQQKGLHQTYYYFKVPAQRNEFIEQLGFTQQVLDSNEFYKTAKYTFYDSLNKKEITHLAEKIINRMMQQDLKGKMILVGLSNNTQLEDDHINSEQAKTLTKATNPNLPYYLLGVIALLSIGLAYLLYDKFKPTPVANLILDKQEPLNQESLSVELMAKEIHKAIEQDELQKKFQVFYEQIKLKIQDKDIKAKESEVNLNTELRGKEAKLQDLQQQLNMLSKKVEHDEIYAANFYQKFIHPFLSYFELHQDYPLKEEGKKELIKALFYISFHAISYNNSKRASADQFDLLNIQEIIGNSQINKEQLVKTSNSPVFGDVPVFIHVICDLLAANHIDSLEEVNIKSYSITKQDS